MDMLDHLGPMQQSRRRSPIKLLVLPLALCQSTSAVLSFRHAIQRLHHPVGLFKITYTHKKARACLSNSIIQLERSGAIDEAPVTEVRLR
jgi:hypothetical protein